MDKIITINLGGYAIKMEEDAYEALKPYIRQIEETFANTENGKEIINDIEARLAEMLMERTEAKVSATIEDVEFVKQAMGNPGEFEDSENGDGEQKGSKEKPKQSALPNDTVRKRLYRDTDNKVFGGVCSGISNYFDIDPTIIRLIWIGLIFFFGTGFLLYFILWIIVPEAVTTAQKLEMKGEAPTLDNIINRVKTEAGKVEQNLKAQNFGQKIGDIFSSLSPLFKLIFKGIALFLGFIILLVLSGTLIALITSNSSFIFNHNDVIIHHIPNFFNTGWEFLTFKILIGLFICIPLFTILTGLLKFGFNTNVNYRPIRKVLGWVWVATIPFILYFIYLGVQNFRSYETVVSEKTVTANAPLVIKSTFGDDDYFMECIEVSISSSDDSLVHITTSQSANGKNSDQARELAEKNGATYTFSGNELTLKTGDYYEKTGLFRGQKVEFEIQIPNGKSFILDKTIQKMGVRVEGQNITYYSNKRKEKPSPLLFIKGSLYCPSCPDSIPIGSKDLNIFRIFEELDVRGNVDVEIRNGNTYSVQKIGPDNILKYLRINQSGNELEIEMDEDHFNFKTRPKVIITMPVLVGLKLSGTSNCESDHFGGQYLKIELSGASKANMDVEYGELNVNISGVSHLYIQGNTKAIDFEVSGASHIYSQNLTMTNVGLNLSGVSEIKLGPSKTITGELSGASKLEYTGNPALQVSSSGVSKIRQVGQ